MFLVALFLGFRVYELGLYLFLSRVLCGKVHTCCGLKISVGASSTLSWTENALTSFCVASSCFGRSSAMFASDCTSAGLDPRALRSPGSPRRAFEMALRYAASGASATAAAPGAGAAVAAETVYISRVLYLTFRVHGRV